MCSRLPSVLFLHHTVSYLGLRAQRTVLKLMEGFYNGRLVEEVSCVYVCKGAGELLIFEVQSTLKMMTMSSVLESPSVDLNS